MAEERQDLEGSLIGDISSSVSHGLEVENQRNEELIRLVVAIERLVDALERHVDLLREG